MNGCYVYLRRADGAFEGRNFNHLDPALEDGALAVHRGQDLTLHQGSRLGQPCLIRAKPQGQQVLISGGVEWLAGAPATP